MLEFDWLRAAAIIRFSALVVAVTLSGHYNPLGPKINHSERLNNVVIAKVEIPVGSRIIPEQLTVAQFPSSVTPQGAISTIDDKIVGRMVYIAISSKDPITEARLARVGARGLWSMIPEGYHAMTVRVDDFSGVSAVIRRGTFVDVVVIISPPKRSGYHETISKIVLQHIRVLDYGRNIDNPKNNGDLEPTKAVTLQVTPEQAEWLALSSVEGKMKLVPNLGRPRGDGPARIEPIGNSSRH